MIRFIKTHHYLFLLLIFFFLSVHVFARDTTLPVTVVVPGKIYRSGQLTRAQFSQCMKQLHLRSIISLRNAAPKAAWYIDEMAFVSNQAHLHYYRMPLPKHTMPSKKQLRRIAHRVLIAPKPLLIHDDCNGSRARLVAKISVR